LRFAIPLFGVPFLAYVEIVDWGGGDTPENHYYGCAFWYMDIGSIQAVALLE
jgi:hypothetical protein